jgi:hypothetical protein
MYPEEILDPNYDDGTMVDSKDALAHAVIGHKIVSAERVSPGDRYRGLYQNEEDISLTLDNGQRVLVECLSDCCAVTEIKAFLLNPELVDHVITGVGTEGDYTTWHIYADAGDVLKLTVDWSCGNPFYYSYGFRIKVVEA